MQNQLRNLLSDDESLDPNSLAEKYPEEICPPGAPEYCSESLAAAEPETAFDDTEGADDDSRTSECSQPPDGVVISTAPLNPRGCQRPLLAHERKLLEFAVNKSLEIYNKVPSGAHTILDKIIDLIDIDVADSNQLKQILAQHRDLQAEGQRLIDSAGDAPVRERIEEKTHDVKGGKGNVHKGGKGNQVSVGKGGKGNTGKGGKSKTQPAKDTPVDKPVKKVKADKVNVSVDQDTAKEYLRIKNRFASMVIGPKGAMVKHIKKLTGAQVKVLEKEPDTTTQKVLITAPDALSVDKAKLMVSHICDPKSKGNVSDWTTKDLQIAFDNKIEIKTAPPPPPQKTAIPRPTKVSISYKKPEEASNLDVEQKLLIELYQNGLLNAKKFRLEKAGAVISLVVGRKSQVDSLCEDIWLVWGEELMAIYAGLKGKASFDRDAFNQRHPRVLERKEAAYLSKGYQGHRTDDHAMFVASFPLSVIEKGDAVNGQGSGCNLEGEKLSISQQILSDSLGLPSKPIFKGKLYVDDEPRALLKSYCPDMFKHDGSEEDVYVLIMGYDDSKSLLSNIDLSKVKEELTSLDIPIDTQDDAQRVGKEKKMLSGKHLRDIGQMGTNLQLQHLKNKTSFEVSVDKKSYFYSSNNKKSNTLRDEYFIDVPGGKRDLGDCLLMAALRELLEEAGCQMRLCNTPEHGALSTEVAPKPLLDDWFGLADKRHLMTDYQQQIFDAPDAVREVEYIGGVYNQVFLIRERSMFESSRDVKKAQPGQLPATSSVEESLAEEEIILIPSKASGSVSTPDNCTVTSLEQESDNVSSLSSDEDASRSEPTPTSVLDPWSCDPVTLPPTERYTNPVAQAEVDEIVELWVRLCCESDALSYGRITHAMKKVAPVGCGNAFVKRIIQNLEMNSRVKRGADGFKAI